MEDLEIDITYMTYLNSLGQYRGNIIKMQDQ